MALGGMIPKQKLALAAEFLFLVAVNNEGITHLPFITSLELVTLPS
jgi:hypothetical protein